METMEKKKKKKENNEKTEKRAKTEKNENNADEEERQNAILQPSQNVTEAAEVAGNRTKTKTCGPQQDSQKKVVQKSRRTKNGPGMPRALIPSTCSSPSKGPPTTST